VREYTILVRYEDDAYLVDVPALKGVHTFGVTLAEAIANAQDAITLYVQTLKDFGEPIPEDRSHPQAIRLTVAA
jgi:predicted RNase H-like HicB family nuclease